MRNERPLHPHYITSAFQPDCHAPHSPSHSPLDDDDHDDDDSDRYGNSRPLLTWYVRWYLLQLVCEIVPQNESKFASSFLDFVNLIRSKAAWDSLNFSARFELYENEPQLPFLSGYIKYYKGENISIATPATPCVKSRYNIVGKIWRQANCAYLLHNDIK